VRAKSRNKFLTDPVTQEELMVRNICHYLRIFIILVLLAGGGLPPPAAQAQAETNVADPETIHIVQRGETLSSIARRYGVTVAALMAANGLTTTTIYVGQRLLIPSGGSTPGTYHVVQRGETLFSISRRYGVTVQAIRAANGLTSNTIYVGQRLIIPTGGGEPTPGQGRRIEFASGQTSSRVTGVVQVPKMDVYLLRASQGQKVRIELISSNAGALLGVIGVSDSVAYKAVSTAGTVFEFESPLTQDYQILVATENPSAVSYEMLVVISPGAAPAPTRITFAPDATSATVMGVASIVAPARYVVAAQSGRQMTVTLTTGTGTT
jgi:LysM repeat protein